MKRILMIGSSHLGAVKLGWDQIAPNFPEVTVSFFGAPAGSFWEMRISEDGTFGAPEGVLSDVQLRSLERTFGRVSVDFRDFDNIVVIGWRIQELFNADALSCFSVEGIAPSPDLPPMTRETYIRMIDAYLTSLLPGDEWKNIPGKFLHFVSQPRMAETCISGSTIRTKAWVELMRHRKPNQEMLQVYLDRAISIYEKAGFALITPPQEVLASNGLTRKDFSRAFAPDQGRKSGDDFDHAHMNVAYGLIMVHTIMAEVLGKS